MKLVNLPLVATTALCLSMAAAHAGEDNKAYLDQTGAANSAQIDQAGGDNNRAGWAGHDVTQNGDDNTLSIMQSGYNNRFGATSNGRSGSVMQTGSQNVLNATQDGFKNQTANVLQTATGGLSGPSNVATIEQMGNYGGIGTLEQRSSIASSSVMNTATLKQFGGNSIKIGTVEQEFIGGSGDTGNVVTIIQHGPTNRVGEARQSGSANSMDIAQTGRTNVLSSAIQNGTGNTANLSFNGTFNGDAGFTSGGGAEAAGVATSSATQIGSDNQIGMNVVANFNQFGFYQEGNSNQATGIYITGDSNELGVKQVGDGNMLSLADITGAGNNLGLAQSGNYNMASLTVTGDRNGGANGFGANIAGTLATSMGMTAGLISQNGDHNDTTLNISGNDNVFATLQDNSGSTSLGNRINGTQDNSGGGAGNQAAVAQMGDGNVATFSQVGGGNVAAVSQ